MTIWNIMFPLLRKSIMYQILSLMIMIRKIVGRLWSNYYENILNELERSEIKHSFKIILYFIQATSFYGKVDGMEGLDWVL